MVKQYKQNTKCPHEK